MTDSETPFGPIPEAFGPEFLDWFRGATEAAWQMVEPDLEEGRVFGTQWQRDTVWEKGLGEAGVGEIESALGMPLPADYRLFLETMHTTDRPQHLTCYGLDDKWTVDTAASFTDWRQDPEAIMTSGLDRLLAGLVADVEDNETWLDDWGPRPEGAEDRVEALQRLCFEAPAMLPVYGHRYLVATPNPGGHPVLSCWGTDVIVYGGDFRDYLLREFGPMLGLLHAPAECPAEQVPFWGGLL